MNFHAGRRLRDRTLNSVTRTALGSAAFLLTALLASATGLPAQSPTADGVAASQAGAQLTHSSESCDETIAYDRGLLTAKPDDFKVELGLARALAACRQYTEAVAVYRRLADANPEAEYLMRETGQALFHAGRSAEAIPIFRRAVAVNRTTRKRA